MKLTPICPYCGNWSEKVTGLDIYPHRPDLAEKSFYRCFPCNAYVGCHPNTDKPLGRLSDAPLRKMKSRVHQEFDELWKSGCMTRKEAYKWLADRMGLEKDDCHVGMFDEDQCARAVEICLGFWEQNED